MAVNRPITAGLAGAGVHHVGKIVSACNSIFQRVDQQNDVGIDAYIEFIVDRSTTGCCIAAQIKSGTSYVREGHFILPADPAHFAYWQSHSLPVVGIVYDPPTDTARWVDITAALKGRHDKPPYTIDVPDANTLDETSFPRFREHFLAYRSQFSDPAFFGCALTDLALINDLPRRRTGLRSLFSFHRQRPETWFYLINSIRSFAETPLLRDIIIVLCHIPGHMDIFWNRNNITDESIRSEAERLMRLLLSRDDVIVLLSAITIDEGMGRGTLGQCVVAIISVVKDRDEVLESIARDTSLAEGIRFWSIFVFVSFCQTRDVDACIRLVHELSPSFSQEHALSLNGLATGLRQHGYVDFT